jgi:hypothetical protein
VTKREKKRLVKEIAQIAEKAYRRGFQQGVYAGGGHLATPAPDRTKVTDWRYAANVKKASVCPPGTHCAGKRFALLDRLEIELDGRDLIRQLLTEVKAED